MKVKFIGYYYPIVLENKVNEFITYLESKGRRVVNIEYATEMLRGENLTSALVMYEEKANEKTP